MNRRELAIAVVALAAAPAGAAIAAKATETEWDGLVRRPSKRFSAVYVLPGADLRSYDQVILEPAVIAFEKNWQRDYNSTKRGLGGRITEQDILNAVADAKKTADGVFADAFAAGGIKLTKSPGDRVLAVTPYVVNIRLTAPAKLTAGRSRVYANESGSATLVIEARDSVTGALLGRAVDSRVVGDSGFMMQRTSASNRGYFIDLTKRWAKGLVDELGALRQAPAG